MVRRRSSAAAVLALTICCAMVVSCSPTAKTQAPAAAPRPGDAWDELLSIENTVWQFGSIKRGETATHSLGLKNESDHELTVSVHSSCDCLTAELDDETLPPGATAELRLAFVGETIKKRVTKTIFVDVFKTVYRVGAESPAQRIILSVTGEVTRGDGPHLYAVPMMLLLEKSGDAYRPAQLRVANRGGADLSVFEVRCFGCIAGSEAFTLAADEEIEIEVNIADDWTQANRWLEIDSNDPVEETRKVPLVIVE